VLAEQAHHVPAGRRQAVIEQRRNTHRDDRLACPALLPGIAIGSVDVVERRTDVDGVLHRRQATLIVRHRVETRQFGERHVHAEGRGLAAIAADALAEGRRRSRGVDKITKEHPRVSV
jgi:hypothetical protein